MKNIAPFIKYFSIIENPIRMKNCNVNLILHQGYTGEDEYIACQGPKEETTYDFWRMINQYNINLIVMLTQLVEKGKVNYNRR